MLCGETEKSGPEKGGENANLRGGAEEQGTRVGDEGAEVGQRADPEKMSGGKISNLIPWLMKS